MREITLAEIEYVAGSGPTGDAAVGMAVTVGAMATAAAGYTGNLFVIASVGMVSAGVVGLAMAYQAAENNATSGGGGSGDPGPYGPPASPPNYPGDPPGRVEIECPGSGAPGYHGPTCPRQ